MTAPWRVRALVEEDWEVLRDLRLAALRDEPDAYGMTQVGISGLSPDAEPSPARLREVADLVKRDGVLQRMLPWGKA